MESVLTQVGQIFAALRNWMSAVDGVHLAQYKKSRSLNSENISTHTKMHPGKHVPLPPGLFLQKADLCHRRG